MDATFFAALLGIIWVDLLLSGDNAVVIALVCKQLPAKQQKLGMFFGAFAAVGLRVVFSFFISWLMLVPGLSLAGGLFLLWVAYGLIKDSGDDEHEMKPATTLLAAVTTIAIADVGMSLDNVMAIAALSHGHLLLMALGVLISIPLVIAGSALIMALIERFPLIAVAGALLLGWVAGGIIGEDHFVVEFAQLPDSWLHYGLSAIGAFVIALSYGAVKMKAREVKGDLVGRPVKA